MGGDKQSSWWMGATDLHHEGSWVWMSGAVRLSTSNHSQYCLLQPWSYEHWNEGEPNQNGNEDCGAFDSQAEGYGW